jgi:hypothetical protein
VFILVGVAIGVGVIVFMSALMAGLQGNFIARVLSAQAHIQLLPPQEFTRTLHTATPSEVNAAIVQPPLQRLKSIDQWQSLITMVRDMPDVTVVSPVVGGSALAVRGSASRAIGLTGVEPEGYFQIVKLPEKIVRGTPRLTGQDMLIGTDLAKFGVESSFVSQTDVNAWTAAVKPSTKLLFAETPTNPLTDVCDYEAVVRVALAAAVASGKGPTSAAAAAAAAAPTPPSTAAEDAAALARLAGRVPGVFVFPADNLAVGMRCRAHCFKNVLIMRAVGDRMIIAPPLTMTHAQIDEMMGLIRKVLDLTLADLTAAGLLADAAS